MIQEAVIVMTLLGCGDDTKSCDYLAGPETKWLTKAECVSAIPGTLKAMDGAPYPTVTATCDRVANRDAPSVDIKTVEIAPERETDYSTAMFEMIRAKSDNTEVNPLRLIGRSFETISQRVVALVSN